MVSYCRRLSPACNAGIFTHIVSCSTTTVIKKSQSESQLINLVFFSFFPIHEIATTKNIFKYVLK